MHINPRLFLVSGLSRQKHVVPSTRGPDSPPTEVVALMTTDPASHGTRIAIRHTLRAECTHICLGWVLSQMRLRHRFFIDSGYVVWKLQHILPTLSWHMRRSVVFSWSIKARMATVNFNIFNSIHTINNRVNFKTLYLINKKTHYVPSCNKKLNKNFQFICKYAFYVGT